MGEKTVHFTVDSALLRELGERLVGKPYVALAELVKNSYDADAQNCRIEFRGDQIIVTDDGHGMHEDEFTSYWMRIGTTHKQREGVSRDLGRPITGSKGVGRLAAQFLAHELEMQTSSKNEPTHVLDAVVDWDAAIEKEELTQAEAVYEVRQRDLSYAQQSIHGTRITLSRLKQSWSEEDFKNLARELWFLQPPLPDAYMRLDEQTKPDPGAFKVEFVTPDSEGAETFSEQMRAALGNWIALISGEIKSGRKGKKARVEVMFQDGESYVENYEMPECHVENAEWRILIFNLSGRQKGKISVQDMRKYFSEFGGVHVYDAGFRLPYYGIRSDWLNIELDHSHRKNKSALLPSHLHVDRALNDLPTMGRMFGWVSIDTGVEARDASDQAKETGEYLKIQVTRDRLIDNAAFLNLQDAVRFSLDFYAVRTRLKRINEIELRRTSESPAKKLSRVEQVLEESKEAIPAKVYAPLKKELRDFVQSYSTEEEFYQSQQMLMAPLATAGMASLAIEHENRKELGSLTRIKQRLQNLSRANPKIKEELDGIASELDLWIKRVAATREVFSPILNSEDRTKVVSLKALSVLSTVVSNIRSLTPGVDLDLDQVPEDLRLPVATFAEWQALFQNVIVNAANAMLDSQVRRVEVVGGIERRRNFLRFSDTGVGVDLDASDQLFEPFQRRLDISVERQALGLGGLGLGLTIVRMVAEARKCSVGFVEPQNDFSTCFEISWSA